MISANAAAAPPRLPALDSDKRASAPLQRAFSLPASALLDRQFLGTLVPLALDFGGIGLGRASLIGGADASAQRPTVTGGLLWELGSAGDKQLRLGVLNSGVDTPGDGLGETLALGSLELVLGQAYYLPTVAIEYAAVRQHTAAPDAKIGLGAGLRLHGKVGAGRYRVRLVRADDAFRPLGATVAAGRMLGAITAEYPLPWGIRARASTRLYQAASGGKAGGRSHTAVLKTPAPSFLAALGGLRFDGRLHTSSTARQNRRWRLAAGSGEIDWRAWRFAGGLDWENRPDAPVHDNRVGWNMRGKRAVGVAGFRGRLISKLRLRRLSSDAWGLASGIGLGLQRRTRRWSVKFDYSADPRTQTAAASRALSVTLSFSVNGGVEPLPRPRGAFYAFRAGARPR